MANNVVKINTDDENDNIDDDNDIENELLTNTNNALDNPANSEQSTTADNPIIEEIEGGRKKDDQEFTINTDLKGRNIAAETSDATAVAATAALAQNSNESDENADEESDETKSKEDGQEIAPEEPEKQEESPSPTDEEPVPSSLTPQPSAPGELTPQPQQPPAQPEQALPIADTGAPTTSDINPNADNQPNKSETGQDQTSPNSSTSSSDKPKDKPNSEIQDNNDQTTNGKSTPPKPASSKDGIARRTEDGKEIGTAPKAIEKPSQKPPTTTETGNTTPPTTVDEKEAESDLSSNKANRSGTPTTSAPGAATTLPTDQQPTAATELDAKKQINQEEPANEEEEIRRDQEKRRTEQDQKDQEMYQKMTALQKFNRAKRLKNLLKELNKKSDNLINFIERMILRSYFPLIVPKILEYKNEIGKITKKLSKKKTIHRNDSLMKKLESDIHYFNSLVIAPILVVGAFRDTLKRFKNYWLSWSFELWWWTIIMAILDIIIIFPFFFLIGKVFDGPGIRVLKRIRDKNDELENLIDKIRKLAIPKGENTKNN